MRKATLLIAPALVGLLVLLGLLVWAPKFARVATATPAQRITIDTTKPRGAFPGNWIASGVVADTGTFHTLSLNGQFVTSATGAPAFQITHVTYLFEGTHGTFTLEAQITETVTADPNILTDNGTWLIQSGTGGYATLHGHGQVVGTVDEHLNLITRTYSGDAHFD